MAAAGVSLFLVAGAAFAANAVMGAPHSTSRDFVPAAATSQSAASKVEPAETAEPTRSPKATGTPEPIETPDVEDESGDNNQQGRDSDVDEHPGARATPTAGAPRSGSAATPEPTHAHGDRGADNGDNG